MDWWMKLRIGFHVTLTHDTSTGAFDGISSMLCEELLS